MSHVFLEKLVIFCSRTLALKYFYFLIKSSKFAFSRFDWLSVTRIGKSLNRNYLRLEGFRCQHNVGLNLQFVIKVARDATGVLGTCFMLS